MPTADLSSFTLHSEAVQHRLPTPMSHSSGLHLSTKGPHHAAAVTLTGIPTGSLGVHTVQETGKDNRGPAKVLALAKDIAPSDG